MNGEIAIVNGEIVVHERRDEGSPMAR